MRKFLAAALTALVAMTTFLTVPASAQVQRGGHRTPIDVDYTTVINDACEFPIMLTGHQAGFSVIVETRHGTVLQFHFREVDVFSAHGKSLTSTPYTFTNHIRFDEEGNLVSATQTGVIVRVPLPNGETFMVAGRADFFGLNTDFVISPTNGVTRNLDDFCASLST